MVDPLPDVDAASRLRAAGLRVTGPRVATLGVLATTPHSDADTVARDVRTRIRAVSTRAVYDVLHALTAGGLVRRIEPAGSRARYELDTGDNHHHVVCRSCGDLQDVPCELGGVPCLVDGAEAAGQGLGFVVDEAEVTFWGLCPACVATTSRSAEPLSEKRSKGPP